MKIIRNIFGELVKDLSENEIGILTGPRQVGKTYLLRELEDRAKQSGIKTSFFDLEQPSELALFNRNDAEIIEMLVGGGDIVFLDEFHYLKNASKIFKAIYDKEAPIKIYASGSSALEIHKHLKESLAGRKYLYHIYPCSLSEMAQVISNAFEYCCVYGGMPGTIHKQDEYKKKQLLSDILQSYVLKDIKSLIREENLRAFNHLLYLLAEAQGSLVSIDSLAREIGLSPHTTNNYLDILTQTYVSFPVYSYSRNLGNELKKSKKFYFYDIGIRNALLKNFATLDKRNDAGAVVETFVFLELQRHISPETEIRFWRLKSGEEVDFLWIKNQIPHPIEVKLNWDPPNIPRGLRAFLKRYPATEEAFVVSKKGGFDIELKNTHIHFISLEDTESIIEIIG